MINLRESFCDYRKIYTVFKNGLHKTCGRDTAIRLLEDGWYDRTTYNFNEEALNHGICTKSQREGQWVDSRTTGQAGENNDTSQRQHEALRCGSNSSSQREESGHQQYQSDPSNQGREESSVEAVRSGQAHGEVIKKRGRPKRAV